MIIASFWFCHLGEVMHPSKFENCGHAVKEAADDEPVQGRGIMNLNRRGCYRSLMTKTKKCQIGFMLNKKLVRNDINQVIQYLGKIRP